ncbi:hypothetical protein Vadar_022985 [Vaccinium darrowii]|uniref:Uncharacterized protein n=1 Tax=Vaccinium darrowii TaxID=229202 RepID=A0ACB7XTT6_9ERIC|nr:hypothetical protein Vadar_022985 [Vaccinium darrowii]
MPPFLRPPTLPNLQAPPYSLALQLHPRHQKFPVQFLNRRVTIYQPRLLRQLHRGGAVHGVKNFPRLLCLQQWTYCIRPSVAFAGYERP